MRSPFVAFGLVAAAGCNDAVILEIAGDRPVPDAVDAICVGVADRDPAGASFGRRYRLEGRLAALPQTLRVEPGAAETAWAWVRADRGGVPIARGGALINFGNDVTLSLDRCERGPAAAPAVVGDVAGPASARLVVSNGVRGQLVVALGATAAVLDAAGDALIAEPAPEPPPGVVDVVAADLDGDCDDDLVIAAAGLPPVIWLRTGVVFAPGPTLGAEAAAVVAGDVDRDGDIDVITGSGASLTLWRNDGSGVLSEDAAALRADGRVTSVTALALGDLDGDGNPDLVVGQAGDPLRAWLGEPGGTGSFLAADAVISPIVADVARLHLADVDGDFDPDLAVVVAGAPLRLFVNREGLLEDQSFPRLGTPPAASAIAIGGWDPGCEPDAVIVGDVTETRRGIPGGGLEIDGDGPAGSDVVMVDLDDDGDLDAVIATDAGARWLAR